MNALTIYEGSSSIVKKPIYGKGVRHNDYGLGFYCTESLDLAKEWAVKENRDGCVNKYVLDLSGLRVLDLSDKGFTTLHWIAILVQNRIFNTAHDVSKEGKRYLINHFILPIENYDVIKGYRADDCYFHAGFGLQDFKFPDFKSASSHAHTRSLSLASCMVYPSKCLTFVKSCARAATP